MMMKATSLGGHGRFARDALASDAGQASYASQALYSRSMGHAGFGRWSLQALARQVRRLQEVLAPVLAQGQEPAQGQEEVRLNWQAGEGQAAAPCFGRLPATRPAPDAHRIVYAGPLSPSSGVADFLLCAAMWAEWNPERQLELCWIGDGDLRGVLMAQPLPANLTQEFKGVLTAAETAEQFGRSGLLVIPGLAQGWPPCLTEAMAAGLAVLGSSRNPALRSLIVPWRTGWLFDPFSAAEMMDALDGALATTPGQLDVIRAAARTRISRATAGAPAPGMPGQDGYSSMSIQI